MCGLSSFQGHDLRACLGEMCIAFRRVTMFSIVCDQGKGTQVLTRRDILASGALCAAATFVRAREATAPFPIWSGIPPGGGGPGGSQNDDIDGVLRHVSRPDLEVFPAERPSSTAVLIASGGGYRRIGDRAEGDPAARWFNRRGVSACVLNYRLPDEGWGAGAKAPLQDAQRALRLMRAGRVPGIGVPTRIAVMGFSAGGHLMGMAATCADMRSYAPMDAMDALPATADAAILVYPVITLSGPSRHTSTHRVLLGGSATPEAETEWSVETHVTAACPPVFMVQAQDDPIALPENTRLMEVACRRAGVPVERHLLASGGHGFGMGRRGTATEGWADHLLAPWATAQGF